MLSITDCVGMCGLTDDELQALVDHEHVPLIVAAELGAQLLKSPKGTWQLRGYLLEALEVSVARGEVVREQHLRHVLAAFSSSHPVPPAL